MEPTQTHGEHAATVLTATHEECVRLCRENMTSDIGADVQSYAQLIQQAGLVSVIASLAFGKNTFVRTEKKEKKSRKDTRT